MFFVDKSVKIFVAVENDRPDTVPDKKWFSLTTIVISKDHLF